MTIEPTDDMSLVSEIMKDDYVWAYAADESLSKGDFVPKSGPFNMWLLAKTDDICGIILMEIESSISVRIHPYMVGHSKGKWFFMMKAFFEWFLESAPTMKKVTAKTPVFGKDVHALALKLGFKEEGIDRESFPKDGEIHDQYILGITKREIQESLKWPQQSH